MRILIIDDEPAVADVLADGVRLQGHAAIVAPSGAEGLAAIDAQVPEAVFLDLVMPDLSGIELLREIRRRHPELPVIVVTGHPEADLSEVHRLGVSDILEKPWALRKLDEALATAEAPGRLRRKRAPLTDQVRRADSPRTALTGN